MKFLIIFALVVASATAFDLRSKEIQFRQRLMSVNKHDGRIAGGENADIVNFSYQVGLELKKNMFTGFWCGGSLIAPDWVLTAAHCTEGINQLTVYLGGAKRAQAEVEYDIVRTSDNIIEHEGYNSETLLNDITLIRIPSVTYSKNIKAVRLPEISSNYATYVGDYATASGWGLMGDNARSVTPLLQSVTLRIISNAECAKTYGYNTVSAGNICLATRDDIIMRSTCQGDSGGPLVLQGTNLQIGLTSYGPQGGCELGYPVAFTRVSYFMDWIVSKTGITA